MYRGTDPELTSGPERLVCVFCGARPGPGRGVVVRLADGSAFACCATACAPLARAVEDRRREAAAAALQLALPLRAG
jgi:ribosomal protein L24E